MMDVLILGKSEINNEIQDILSSEGLGSEIVSSVNGGFKANGFSPVIITEPPLHEAPLIDGEPTINLMDDAETKKVIDLKGNEKIAILLDFAEESPEYITAKAIDLARHLAMIKKEVVFISKTVKSGYDGGEQDFRAARRSGVSFIKYDSTAITYDVDTDMFDIQVSDGVFDSQIKTPYILSAVVRETPELISILKKLRLYRKVNGDPSEIRINDDRFFLGSVLTSRYGIYYINPAHGEMGVNKEALKEAMYHIVGDIKSNFAEGYIRELVRGQAYPIVDSIKCAFCYSCFRVCPHGALEPDLEASAMKVVEPLCQACGTCIAICPGEAIARKGEAESGVKTGVVKESGSNKPCKIYLCENGAEKAFEDTLPALGKYGELFDKESVSCGGSVGVDTLLRDSVKYEKLIIACCMGDACRHMDGDKRACKHSERASALLVKAGLEEKRVEVIKVSHTMKNILRDRIINILEEKD